MRRAALLAMLACLSMLRIGQGARAQEAETVVQGLQFPEGTIFVGDTLYFVDYSTSDVLRLAHGKVERVWHQNGCGANGLVQVADGLLVACYDSGIIARVSFEGRLIETIAKDDAGHKFNSPNDLAADAKGGVYFTGSGWEGEILGKVYYLSPDHRVREVASGIHYANGLAVSPDGRRLYVAETRASRLLRFDIASDCTLGTADVFVNLPDILTDRVARVYSPDGVRIDRHGNLFIGLYSGGGFAVIDPDGRLVARREVPASHHANLAISPDGKSVFATGTDDVAGGSYRGQIFRLPNPLAE